MIIFDVFDIDFRKLDRKLKINCHDLLVEISHH